MWCRVVTKHDTCVEHDVEENLSGNPRKYDSQRSFPRITNELKKRTKRFPRDRNDL